MMAVRGTRTKTLQAMHARWRSCMATAVAILLLSAPAPALLAADQTDPAHDIADKFSRASEMSSPRTPASSASDTDAQARANAERADAERRAAEQQRAYEEEMLARARAEAKARLKADMARERELARQRAKAEADARKAQAEAVEKQRAMEKAEAEQRARQEEEARRASEAARQRAQAERLEAEREREARELAERLRAARRAREDERARAAAQAQANSESQAAARLERARQSLRLRKERLAGRLAAIKAERARRELARTRTAPVGTSNGVSSITTGATSPDEAGSAPLAASDTHATVLLVMTPGKRGIRRWKKTADPMLCVEGSCYISQGAALPAQRVSRRKGFGPGIALGKRAGACNDQLACVFRDVDLGAKTAWMQPVDLRVLRHDRREALRITADPTCAVTGKRISCSRTIESDDYRAWIIPEHIARAAGKDALKQALRDNLQAGQIAHSPRR